MIINYISFSSLAGDSSLILWEQVSNVPAYPCKLYDRRLLLSILLNITTTNIIKHPILSHYWQIHIETITPLLACSVSKVTHKIRHFNPNLPSPFWGCSCQSGVNHIYEGKNDYVSRQVIYHCKEECLSFIKKQTEILYKYTNFMQVMLMRLMSKGEYVIVPKGTKFRGGRVN